MKWEKLTSEFISEVENAIQNCWADIAFDAAEMVDDNEGAIEVAIDGGRLSSTGYKKEDAIVMEAVAKFGYVRVLKYMSKHIHLDYNL